MLSDSDAIDTALRAGAPSFLLRRYLDFVSPARVDRVPPALELAEAVARYLTALLGTDARATGQGAALDELLAKLDRPSFGDWVTTADRCAVALHGRPDATLPEVAAILRDADGPTPALRALWRLVELRNALKHDADRERQQRALAAEVDANTRAVLGSLGALRAAPLMYVRAHQVLPGGRTLQDAFRLVGELKRETLEDARPLPTQVPLVLTPRGDALVLAPWVWVDPHTLEPQLLLKRVKGVLKYDGQHEDPHAAAAFAVPATDLRILERRTGEPPIEAPPTASAPRRARPLAVGPIGVGGLALVGASLAGTLCLGAMGRGAAALFDVGAPIEMVTVQPGEFDMGSPPSDPDRHEDETSHRVRLTRTYALGRTEVTVAQWNAVMGADRRPGADDLPVTAVSWNDAVAFCAALSEREGLRYRLPTEAEWEYAARAGGPYRFSGSDDPGDVSWTKENANGTPHPVAEKKPNTWGLYDMSGNVYEWVSDWHPCQSRPFECPGGLGYSGAGSIDPLGVVTGTERVHRGGSFRQEAMHARIANRAFYRPTAPNSTRDGPSEYGFRVARDLGP